VEEDRDCQGGWRGQRVHDFISGYPYSVRMNQDSKKFGRGLLESDFEFGLDVVDAGEREIVGERASGRTRRGVRALS